MAYSKDLHRKILSISKETKYNPLKFWDLKDEYFFGAGACHILAYTFKEKYKDYDIYLIKASPRGTHLFASNSISCFDYQGYSDYKTYMKNYSNTCTLLFTNWSYNLIKITDDFNIFCEKYNHRKREAFLHDPKERAKKFILSKGQT